MFLNVAHWVSDSFPIIRIVLLIAMVLLSLFMIVAVMLQPSASDGMGAISGGQQDTFFGKNKGKTLEGTLKRATVGVAISLVVICILFFVSLIIYSAS